MDRVVVLEIKSKNLIRIYPEKQAEVAALWHHGNWSFGFI